MTKLIKKSILMISFCLIAGCSSGSALQLDRAIFSLDNNYQRFQYSGDIEITFESTLQVFRDAGYSIDVADRATGQISGQRGASGDSRSSTDKDLKFYALILPVNSGSQVALKVVQVVKSGAFGSNRSEIIVNDVQMYQFAFRRIESLNSQTQSPDSSATPPDYGGELPASSGYNQRW